MKRFLRLTAVCLALATSLLTHAQDFSNKGKEFWISYSYHVGMVNAGGAPQMSLHLTSDVNTTFSVEAYGSGLIQSGTITAGQVTVVFVPNSYFIDGDGKYSGRAIHVTAAKPIVVYSYITRSAASAATLCLPTNVLGKEYYSSNFTQTSNEANSSSFITIIAIEDNTSVEVTTTAPTIGGWAANSVHTVDLDKGQVYQVLGTTSGTNGVDLTGSKIRSVATGSGGCKRIAVFSGSGKINIGCSNGSADNLYQQLYPTGSWGQKYLTVPSYQREHNYFRIIRNDPTTNVYLNGNLLNPGLFTNNYYEFNNSAPNLVEADKPVSLSQYFSSASCAGNGSPYDPDMIVLNPVEQNIDKVTLVSTSLVAGGPQHHMHVIMRNGGTGQSSFKMDGIPRSGWVQHPADPNYSYLYLSNVAQNYHTLSSDSGFNAIAYGYASAESYAYSAGANVKDLYQFVTLQNQFSTVNFPATCKGSNFFFAMTFPYQPTQIQWQFSGLFPDVTLNNPTYDSSWVLNGKTLYRYKLPGAYVVNTVGTYPIKVLAQNPTSDGCNGEQEIDYDLEVSDQPAANFTFSTDGCVSNPVQFTNTSATTRPIISFGWNFGDGGTADVANPSHQFATSGQQNVTMSFVTDIGCVSTPITKPVVLSALPVAAFNFPAQTCINLPVTFTQNSTTPAGVILVWYWNFGDGSAPVAVGNGNPQTHTYTIAGNYNVTLQVETSTGCKSTVSSQPIAVGANLSPTFTFGSACLPDGTISFTNTTSTGGSYTSAWLFGDGGNSTDQNPSHTYAGTGPFNVTLIVTTPSGCSGNVTLPVNTIYAQPHAAFAVDRDRTCAGNLFTFTNASTAPNSTTTEWHWDFGNATTSSLPNPTVSYASAGTYFIKLWTKSAAGCVSDTARDTLTVLPPPVASFVVDAHRCATDNITVTSNSSTTGGNITQYQWFINGTLNAATGSSLQFTPPTSGSYQVRLSINTDAGCSDDSILTITVNPKPVPDFTIPTVCLPAGSATFTNATTISDGSIGTTTYSWNFGDGGTATAPSPTHIYSAVGPFTVSLTATSANGCVASASKPINTIYAAPLANFAPPAEVCLGAATTFTDGSAASNSTVTQWLWTFDDNTTSTLQNPTKTFATSGPHTVTLKVTSATGCVSSVYTGSAVVNALPTAAFTIGSPSCVTRNVTFTDASQANSGNIVSWNWNVGEGSPVTNSTNAPVSHTYAATGDYPVSLTVTTNKGCVGTKLDAVHIKPLPVPGFTLPENCLNDPFSQFNDTSHIVDGSESQFTYSWNFGDGNATPGNPNTGTGASPRHKYTAAGTYQVNLTVTSGDGCSATLPQSFTVNGAVPQSAFAVVSTDLCSNKTITLQNNSTVDVGNIIKLEIFWDAGDVSQVTVDTDPVVGKTYTHKYPEHYTPAVKSYTVRVMAYSGDNCVDPDIQTINMKATPDVVFDPITAVCADASVRQLTQASTRNSADVPGTGVFTGGTVSASGSMNPATMPLGKTMITYAFTGTNGCVNSAQADAEIFLVPVVNAGPDRAVLEGGSDSLLATSTGSNLSFAWTPARWLSSSTVLRPKVMPLDDEQYSLTVTTGDGCTASDVVLVKFLIAPTIPNVFTPNGDGRNDKWEVLHLETYPGATVEIYNRYGQIVYKAAGYAKPWDGTFNGKDLPIGTYYYIINPKNGRRQMTGFVDLIR
jgi:gliding motility-associated-like protein